MAEYIDREAAIARIKEAIPYHENLQNGLDRAISYLKSIPAADVRPVVRGKWICDDDGTVFYVCSACGKAQYRLFTEIFYGEINYCPNCGAEMEADP